MLEGIKTFFGNLGGWGIEQLVGIILLAATPWLGKQAVSLWERLNQFAAAKRMKWLSDVMAVLRFVIAQLDQENKEAKGKIKGSVLKSKAMDIGPKALKEAGLKVPKPNLLSALFEGLIKSANALRPKPDKAPKKSAKK